MRCIFSTLISRDSPTLPVKHTRWHVSTTTVLLQCVQALQDKAFTGGETVSYIREIIIRITVVHGGSTLVKEDLQ
jgi:hypothetical protein